MPIIRLKDDVIGMLVSEAKHIPYGLCSPHRAMPQRNGNYQKTFDVSAPSGNEFVVKLRQGVVNPANFPVILGYKIPVSYTVFRLRRYNGRHPHSNHLEGERFQNFHIHMATERYQKVGCDEESYAQETNLHWDLNSAIERMLEDCGFIRPQDEDLPLFRKQP